MLRVSEAHQREILSERTAICRLGTGCLRLKHSLWRGTTAHALQSAFERAGTTGTVTVLISFREDAMGLSH